MEHKGESKRKILIVDDADYCRKIVAATMRILGHQIETAINGQEAVKIIKKSASQLDLVILDLRMPVLSGSDVLKIVQPEIKKYNLPVVILTGIECDKEEINRLTKLGAVGHLKKSDPPDKFLQKIKKILKSKSL